MHGDEHTKKVFMNNTEKTRSIYTESKVIIKVKL